MISEQFAFHLETQGSKAKMSFPKTGQAKYTIVVPRSVHCAIMYETRKSFSKIYVLD